MRAQRSNQASTLNSRLLRRPSGLLAMTPSFDPFVPAQAPGHAHIFFCTARLFFLHGASLFSARRVGSPPPAKLWGGVGGGGFFVRLGDQIAAPGKAPHPGAVGADPPHHSLRSWGEGSCGTTCLSHHISRLRKCVHALARRRGPRITNTEQAALGSRLRGNERREACFPQNQMRA